MASLKNNPMVLCLFFFFFLSISFVFGELRRFEQPAKAHAKLSFLVIGDWGRRGFFNQSQVALQMGKVGEKLEINFVVSTGDNFYDNGLKGEHDTAFEDSFTKIYTANSLQKQWYSVLGNHDYRGDAEAQLSPLLRQIDSRWLCLRSFIVNAQIADFFFVDTTPFVSNYFAQPNEHQYDWRGLGSSRQSYIQDLLKDVEAALKESKATWKIVIGHHPIRTIGHHGDTTELIHHLLPILQANNVDFYMNGHVHCLEHISEDNSKIQFLTSGAGSKVWRGDVNGLNKEGLKFFYDGQGFMSVELTQDHAAIEFYDVFGKVLHRWSTPKQIHLDI